MSDTSKKTNVQMFTRLADVYSDVTITFSDPIRVISVKAHRNILALHVPYFHNLFTFGDNLQKKEFNIPVEDAAVAELFIESLYGQRVDFTSDCCTFLHLCKLRSYLCLDIDLEQLYQVKVPAENFDLLLQVVNLPEIKLNRRLFRTIKRNVPKDYTWEGVNEDFKQEVMRKEKYIISGGKKEIKIWDLNVITEIRGEIHQEDLVSKALVKTLTGHTGWVASIVMTKDQQHIVSAGLDKSIKIWNLASGECVKTLTGHKDWIRSIVLTEDQQHIVSAGLDKSIKIWNLASGECVKTLTGHKDCISSIVLTEDQQHIISGSSDQTIKIWEAATGECVKTIIDHTDNVASIVLTKDQKHIVSAGTSKTIKIWHLASGECVKTLTGHTHYITSIVLTKDLQHIVSAGVDQTVKIWKIDTGECVKTLTGHTDLVLSIVTTEDQYIISASRNKTFKIWNIASGECVKTWTDDENSILFLALLE